ncbi:ABC transporter permease [Mycetocola reblochoni]|uniref:ABC transporter, permease protein n=2 Tax=Mycetocola reblochoni TaxID=331618 RepID=A0A1R4JZX4_9MICO|nr:ABC transporter permease [Mycetocola reblochoni]RLP70506.1 ABC transporter permease [Mycetocola reblochoni]SJN37532.1 ABC transporter, permease protein [Mycetocola reblochoni REB411]
MSVTTPSPELSVSASLESATVKNWKAPIVFAVFSVIAVVVFVGFRREGVSEFRFATGSDFFAIPPLVVGSTPATIVLSVLLLALTGYSVWRTSTARTTPIWLVSLFGVLFVADFLAWVVAGNFINATGLLLGSIALSAPLIFGALGGVISERVGVVNVAIEGQLLAGAFTSAMVASMTGNALVGLLAAMVAGVLVGMVLAVFSIRYLVEQVIVGVVLNVLVAGLTGFLYSTVMGSNEALFNSPPKLPQLPIPVLSEIPVIGPILFRQTLIIYLMYVAIFLVWWGLYKTKWGLRLRAVGEHPQAADTVGIRVNMTRFWNVSLAGAIAGLGGAYFTLGSVGGFTKEMTAGAGFIALAAVIFGRWDPIKATLAALLFGFASNLQNVLGAIGSPVPSEFMLMLPYVITILAVAGFVGQSRGPAASGKAYVKQ